MLLDHKVIELLLRKTKVRNLFFLGLLLIEAFDQRDVTFGLLKAVKGVNASRDLNLQHPYRHYLENLLI